MTTATAAANLPPSSPATAKALSADSWTPQPHRRANGERLLRLD
ncbi:hypothetical protein CCACVL1_28791 [Corchorus capsularis]|uniref:Uncharacterized protein n=1 Tax=Corchorus capsularis TaxID=210143 RepID=A0A1R3G575_COCAP|nr:hypothetical protein CCACVL1_28791 [Corchorus capsularis]